MLSLLNNIYKMGYRMKDKLKNEIKNEKKKLSKMSFGKKVEYIFDYYKFYIIGVVIAVVIVTSVVRTWINNKPLAFYGMFLNGSGTEMSISAEDMEKEFADYAGIDDGEQKVVIDTTASFNPNVNSQFSMAENAKITALFASHDLDAMVIDPGVFTYYALNGAFLDLRQVLQPADFNEYVTAGKIYYIDGAVQKMMAELDADTSSIEEKATEKDAGYKATESEDTKVAKDNVASETDESLDEMSQFAADLMGLSDVISRDDFEIPDPANMKEPIPVGIILDKDDALISTGYFDRTVPIFGVPAVSDRKNLSIKFLDFLEGGLINN